MTGGSASKYVLRMVPEKISDLKYSSASLETRDYH